MKNVKIYFLNSEKKVLFQFGKIIYFTLLVFGSRQRPNAAKGKAHELCPFYLFAVKYTLNTFLNNIFYFLFY